jgi:Flp pilus assembly protein TadG
LGAINMRTRKGPRRTGSATVEFAVLLPFLAFLCVIVTDWARLYYYTVSLESCARNGCLYASDAQYAAQSPYSNVTQAALAEAPFLNAAATVTTATTTDTAGNPAISCTVSVPFQTITNFPGVPSSQTLTRTVQMRVGVLFTS